MADKQIKVPDNRNYEYALQQAFQIAGKKLLAIADIEAQCRRSGSKLRRTGRGILIEIRYLGKPFYISIPDIEITPGDETENLSLREKVLMLHYFTGAKGTPPSGRSITFREFPEGLVYLPTFSKRTAKPLVEYFGEEPEKLLRASETLGGIKADIGDVAVTIPAFHSVPLTFVLWSGDEEFSPQANILYDANVKDYLPIEDIIIIGEILTWKLVHSLTV